MLVVGVYVCLGKLVYKFVKLLNVGLIIFVFLWCFAFSSGLGFVYIC